MNYTATELFFIFAAARKHFKKLGEQELKELCEQTLKYIQETHSASEKYQLI